MGAGLGELRHYTDFGVYPVAAPCHASSMDSHRPAEQEPSPFQKFDSLMRQIIRVPKAEVERRAEEAKKQRKARRNGRE